MVAAQTNGCFGPTADSFAGMSARSVSIRRARPGDGPAFVRMHAELGETYATLSPELFQRPVTAGLADEVEALVAMDDERALHLIAEVDGEPAAVLGGTASRLR
jgi:hypothetical protein